MLVSDSYKDLKKQCMQSAAVTLHTVNMCKDNV